MSKKTKKPNGKHLLEEDRAFIAEALSKNMKFKEIAAILGKDPGTISKEIRTNRTFKSSNTFNDKPRNRCIHRKNCEESYICEGSYPNRLCQHGCSVCRYCNGCCKKFEKEICSTLTGAPYACNGCKRKQACHLEKYYYKAVTAQRKYEERLSKSRQGINLNEEDWIELDNFITPLIQKGQPISHIYNMADGQLPCSKSTLYRYIGMGILSVKKMDMRRVVRYKKRKQRPTPRETACRKGRTYTDFLEITSNNPDLNVWEMDIVEGKKGGSVLLTLFSRSTKLMLIYWLEEKTQDYVIVTLDYLEECLGIELFNAVFQIILTDNGSEFLSATRLEQSFLNLNRCRTKIFYCDPYSSYQKGGIEKNHEYIRYVLPKGTSFDELDWYDVAMLASHINSVARDSLNGLCPTKAFPLITELPLLDHVLMRFIAPHEVNLTPSLLKER